MVAQMTFHEPGFGVPRIDGQNAIKKYLGHIPAFLGDCARSV